MIPSTDIFQLIQTSEASYSLFDASGYLTDAQVISGLTSAQFKKWGRIHISPHR